MPIKTRNEKLAAKVVAALQERYFEAYYCKTKEDALALSLSLIPENHTVAWGGSATVTALGLQEKVKTKFNVIDRDAATTPEEKTELMRRSLLADTYLTGVNAISEQGELVNVDGFGNRVAAMIYGPTNVIAIAGMNKIVKSLEDAIGRARNHAAPINAQRFPELRTPCATTGSCGNCKSPDSICSYISIIRMCRPAGKIKVILIGEELGF